MTDDPVMLAKQVELEQLYSKNQTITRIRKEFIAEPMFAKQMKDTGIPVKFGHDLLTYMALHKRADLPTMVGLMRHHFDDLQDVADMLLKAAMADLVDWNSLTKQFVVIFTITQDVQDEIDRYQFPLPMVIEPREVNSNRASGYVLGKESVILRNNHHEDDVCLDHLNRVNKTKFTINERTMNMVRNQWRNLDKPKQGESKQDFQKRKRAFEKYDRSSREVMQKLIDLGNEFYLTHRYDKRGRTYTQGYHINPQGTPYNKAVVELADKEMVR